MKKYRIYTKQNLADTCRDSDDYRYEEVGDATRIEKAIEIANKYINKHFFHKDTKLRRGSKNILYTATDFCSYGKTIIIE
jgi:hypothetical protein